MFWSCLCLFLCIQLKCSSCRPNILILIADDLGWGDVGFHGSDQVQTPNIDLLSADGIHLTNYYVSPICSPSRSALLTGIHPIHTGMQHGVIAAAQPYGLPLKYRILPQYMYDLGYTSHLVGKWHQGFFQKEYWPTKRGFKTHFGYMCGKEDYYDHSSQDKYWGLDFWENEEPADQQYAGQYSTTLYEERTKEILRSYQNQSEPFLIVTAFQAVHTGNEYSPFQVPSQYLEKFGYIKDERRRKFAGMLFALDEAIGEIFEELQSSQLIDNTIVIFSTDNGGATGGSEGRIDGSVGSNWPLRGTKYTLWEGGIRGVSFIWSRLLKKSKYHYDKLMHIQDWLPTLYSAAGGQVSKLPNNLDGVNHWHSLNGHKEKAPRIELLHNIDRDWDVFALRYKQFKIISGTVFDGHFDGWFPPVNENDGNLVTVNDTSVVKDTLVRIGHKNIPSAMYKVECGPNPENVTKNCYPTVEPCLFNIELDPCEYKNIAKNEPLITKFLLSKVDLYQKTYHAPVNQPPDSEANPALHDYLWRDWKS